MLNERGRIELETTVVNMSHDLPGGGEEEVYYLVCAAFFEQRLLDHLTKHRGHSESDVRIETLSEAWAALSLNGPKSREVLMACTTTPLANADFPWLSAKVIQIAGHELWAFRMSYAGELGWELHMPRDALVDVYTALSEAGAAHGIADYGSFAMNVMRMEKGFKGAGELTNEVTLAEADVLRFARTDKDYVGRDKTLNADVPWVCTYLSIDPDGHHDGHGGEAVLHRGKVVGSTASVAFGHTVGTILAFAYIKPEAAVPGTRLEVIIAGQPRAARVLGDPAYDPESRRPRTDAPHMEPAE
jgi:dimethylglycine dehydrogenase